MDRAYFAERRRQREERIERWRATPEGRVLADRLEKLLEELRTAERPTERQLAELRDAQAEMATHIEL